MADTPFSKAYVLRATMRHMRKSIDISITKTSDRWPEFKDNPDKTKEITETLMHLHTMRKNLEDFQAAHQAEFKENING